MAVPRRIASTGCHKGHALRRLDPIVWLTREEHRTVGDFGTQKRLERALGAPLVDWRKESSGQPVHGSTVTRNVTRREP